MTGEKEMKILVIIPAYNEAENIEKVVNNLIENYPQYDYLVINDGSKDATAAICRRCHFNLLDLSINLGLAGGVQAGYEYAYENGYDYALQFDGDGQHQPQYIEMMIAEMERTNADIVIGSRFVEKKKPRTLRMMGSHLISGIIMLTTRKHILDPTSGMRLFNRNMIKRFAYTMNHGPEPDTISYLLRCGAKVGEVQVEMKDREAGESYLNLKRSIQYMFHMCMSIIFVQRFRKKERII